MFNTNNRCTVIWVPTAYLLGFDYSFLIQAIIEFQVAIPIS